MSSNTQRFDLAAEIRLVGADFESVAAALRAGASREPAGSHASAAADPAAAVLDPSALPVVPGPARRDPGATPDNLSLALPYHLIEAFRFRDDLDCARAMSRANAFGMAHFLEQDRVLDLDEDADPRAFAFSDTCFLRFLLGYSEIFPASSLFWPRVESYLREYFESLAWERETLWSDSGVRCVAGDELRQTLDMLGRKMAPLKCTTAAVSLLTGQAELERKGAELIDSYHAAYQLVDDLSDLAADAASGRWSVPLRLMESLRPEGGSLAELSREDLIVACVRCGAHELLVRSIGERYAASIALADELGLSTLSLHIRASRDAAVEGARWAGRRARVLSATGDGLDAPTRVASAARAAGSTSPPVMDVSAPEGDLATPHSFSFDGRVFVVDPSSCLFFEADDVAADALSWVGDGAQETGRRVLELDHGAKAVRDALREIELVSPPGDVAYGRPSREPGLGSSSRIVSLALNVTSGCNLACDYCYLGGSGGRAGKTMSLPVARRATELLLEESSNEPAASLVFFGGEPLLERQLVLDVAASARRAFRERGRRLSMHMTTNGTMLDARTAAALDDLGVSVLVSVDGPPAVQDGHRRFADGAGSYASLASNMRELPDGVTVSARVTLTRDSAGLVETVEHLKGLGFRTVSLSPVSGQRVSSEFCARLVSGYEELARWELERVSSGRRPSVGNFVRVMRGFAEGRPRRRHCGAGARYLCVSPEGRLYLCHRFAGQPEFEVGNVFDGIDRPAVDRLLAELSTVLDGCSDCWARFLCGGACFHDAHVARSDGEDPLRCEVSKRLFELSMWMYASLPDEVRRRLEREEEGAKPCSAPTS